jgi:RNA polymerase sigma-70 factor (ECF subfamily)
MGTESRLTRSCPPLQSSETDPQALMENSNDPIQAGPLDTRYLAFLETITHLRPHLHRYCARMTGSVMDGEDVVQEALFEAYRKLDKFDESRPLKPWLFRIAHNRSIDFLRRRGARDEAETTAAVPELMLPTEPSALGIGPALEHLVTMLPPKERACVLLKDVFDYSLEEIADFVDSTVGGVKSALSRARTKLAASSPQPKARWAANSELRRVLQLYVERFNRRDWDAVRELISADAQLRVVDAFVGKLVDSPYFSNYARWRAPWKLLVGEASGETVAVVLQRGVDTWTPYSFVRFNLRDGKIDRIVDYSHCPWIASLAESVVVADVD